MSNRPYQNKKQWGKKLPNGGPQGSRRETGHVLHLWSQIPFGETEEQRALPLHSHPARMQRSDVWEEHGCALPEPPPRVFGHLTGLS